MLVLTIIISILILSLVLLAHEFGHFLACKILKVKVEEFGFGFPPRALKLFKKGETLFTLNWIPFGGFNKILGEEGGSQDNRAYNQQKVWSRIFIASGGILANFVLAWIVLTAWFLILPYIHISKQVVIVQTIANSAAERAGIKSNDVILSLNDQKIEEVEEVSKFTQSHRGTEITLKVKHQGEEETKKVMLSDGSSPLGVSLAEVGGESYKIPWYKAPTEAFLEMMQIIWITIVFLAKAVASLFGGQKTPFELTGPIGLVAYLNQAISIGWFFLFRLAAIISLGLGFFNLLPIPAADGGKLSFLSLELLFGKKVLKEETENTVHAIGFIILIILSIVIAYFDIIRLIK